MVVGICTLDFFLPGCKSLKQKRMFVRSLKDRLRNKHNIAIAEVDYLDLWQRTRLGITSVSNDQSIIDSTFQAILRTAERAHDGQLVDFQVEYL